MRFPRHIVVLSSAIAVLLGCSSPDSAAVVAKNEAPPTISPDAGDGPRDAGDVSTEDSGPDGGVATKEAGVASMIQANVRFLLKSVSPSESLLPNTSYDFSFEIGIHSSHDETFQLVPHIDAGWNAVVAGPDTIDATVASAVAGMTVTKTITVTTGAAGVGALVLDLKATHFPTFAQSSLPTSIVVGETPTIPDGVIQTISIAGIGPTDFVTDTLRVPRQPVVASLALEALLQLSLAGTYNISFPVATPSSDWTVKSAGPATITTNAAGLTSMIGVTVTPKSDGGQFDAVDGELSFTITSADGMHSLPFTAHLRVVDGP